MKLEELSALELGRLVNDRQVSPTEVLQYFEDRINKRNSSINAFVYTRFDEAYIEAKNLENRLANHEYCGPFAGVPFALKDFLPSKKGWTHSHGGVKCLIKEDPYSSEFCLAMENAGGIAIGKTNAPAYGFRGTTDNRLYGPTSTPFNIKYNSGGSSGGSAAAVADGLVPIAEGGDAGGSIRLPASWCNLYGFKPGIGFVPSVARPDAYCASHPVCAGGGLTKTVADTRALMSLMHRYDRRDPYSYESLLFSSSRKLKIAYTRNFGLFDVEPEMLELIEKTIEYLRATGFDIEEVNFNFKHSGKEIAEQWCKGITVDCAIELNQEKERGNDFLATDKQDFPDEFIYWKEQCDKLGIMDLFAFNEVRTEILDQFENVFDNYDFIISPVTNCFPILNKDNFNTKGPDTLCGKPIESLIGWTQTFLANFNGYPAASIPAGLSKDNLPFGLQVIGKRHRDYDLLDLSKEIETIMPWNPYYQIALDREIK